MGYIADTQHWDTRLRVSIISAIYILFENEDIYTYMSIKHIYNQQNVQYNVTEHHFLIYVNMSEWLFCLLYVFVY